MQIDPFCSGQFTDDAYNIILVGDEPLCAIGSRTMANGTGKTHISIALGTNRKRRPITHGLLA